MSFVSISGYWGRFADKSTIPLQAYNGTWYKTYWNNESNIGYVMSQYVTNVKLDGSSSGDGGTGGTTTSSFTSGHFGRTNATGVNVRKEPKKTAANYGQVKKGSTFYIEGVVTGTAIDGNTDWVQIRYGKASGGSVSAYIHSNFFEDIGSPSSIAKTRCTTIAKSLVGNSGASLGLGGDWCQNFIYWLCGACGKTVTCMSFGEGVCGDARVVMVSSYKATWNSWYAGLQPNVGDLVYYGTVGASTSQHVGLIVSVNSTAKTYTSIEGNLSDSVKQCTGDYSAGTCSNNKKIQGFLTPNW